MGVHQRAKITLTDAEIAAYVAASRTMTLASIAPGGQPHLVAMWYAVIDGIPCLETKAKSQKAANIRRDPRISALIEDGDVYEDLRGVSLEGTAEIVEDPDFLWQVGVNLWERYYGPYTEDLKPFVEQMLTKRVAVRITVERTRSWDHRKLGLPATGPPGGSTVGAIGGRPPP